MVSIIVIVAVAIIWISLAVWIRKSAANEPVVPGEDGICVPDQPEPPPNPEDWEPAPDPGPLGESDNLDDLLDADGNIK